MQMFFGDLFVELHAQARAIRNVRKAALDQRWMFGPRVRHKALPPRDINAVMFQREEVVGRRRAMHVRHERNRRASKVHRHRDATLFRRITDLLRFQQTA